MLGEEHPAGSYFYVPGIVDEGELLPQAQNEGPVRRGGQPSQARVTMVSAATATRIYTLRLISARSASP